ncbi:MAG: DUF4339 domain-containing protein [Chthoniobacterales bacterium]
MTTIDAMEIYVLKSGVRYGPYSQEELQKQLKRGFFAPQDFASYDQDQGWIPITEVPGIVSRGFAVEIDPENNLLVIRYFGRVESAAVEQCLARVRAELEKLETGFLLLADLTELDSMDPACVPSLEKIMEACNEKGVSAIARVVPDPKRDIGLQILSQFHYGANVSIVTCVTMDEAMSRLGL